jgi:hypothetical protein
MDSAIIMTSEMFVINQFPDKPDLWKILSITHPNGSDRIDGHYPSRICCTVIILKAEVGESLVWSYVADSDGNEKQGCWTSSKLNYVSYDPNEEIMYAKSHSSHYRLKKWFERWGDIYAERNIVLPDWYPGEFGALPVFVPKICPPA